MKKIILVLLVFIICSPSYSEIKYHLEIGNAIEYSNYNNNEYTTNNYSYYYGIMKIGYSFNTYSFTHLFYFSNTKWVIRDNSLNGHPLRNIYSINYQLKYNIIFINLNHFCNHPVNSGEAPTSTKWMSNYFGEDITTLSIGISNF